MNRNEKSRIRSKHSNWIAYRVARMALESIPEMDGLKWASGKTNHKFREIGYIINQGMENHHDWNRPNEINDFLTREEHLELHKNMEKNEKRTKYTKHTKRQKKQYTSIGKNVQLSKLRK